MTHFSSLFLRVTTLAVLATGLFAQARTITGTVTNGTNGKASAGDKVTLLSLSAALDEVGTAKTDSKGKFTLKTPAEEPYLIKVEHQKGSYFKNVPPTVSAVEIMVYDVATKVPGVSTEADVLRIEADGSQVKVTENYFVKNTSSPPRTESSEHTYEIVLPADAVLDGAATVGPSNMPLAATPDPVSPKGHYAFSFPIRPNEGESGTRFQLSYHMPYSGRSYKFTPRLMVDSDNVAIMLPKGVSFTPGAKTSYQNVPDNTGEGQMFLARGVKAGQPLEFSISGTGSFPREAQGAGGQGGPGAAGGAAGAQASDSGAPNGPGGAPGGGLGNPIDTPDPLSKYKYWILGSLGLVLVVAAAFLLRKPAGESGNAELDALPRSAAFIDAPVSAYAPGPPAESTAVATSPASASVVPVVSLASAATKSQLLLEALKEELFAIESEKIAGRLTAAEYAEVKAALEVVLRRALARR